MGPRLECRLSGGALLVGWLGCGTATAIPLEPVLSRTLTAEYRHGVQVMTVATPAGPIALQMVEDAENALVIVVAARNDSEAPILFAPETIQTQARMYALDETWPVIPPKEILDRDAAQHEQTRRDAGRRAALEQIASTSASHAGGVTSKSISGALIPGGPGVKDAFQRALADTLTSVPADIATVAQRARVEQATLDAEHLSAAAALSERLILKETLSAGETLVGEVWIEIGDVALVEHLVIAVPFGGHVARFEFGDPTYDSSRCDVTEWPRGATIGWLQMPGVLGRPQRGEVVLNSREAAPVVDDASVAVCTIPAGWAIPLLADSIRRRGSGIWVPLVGSGGDPTLPVPAPYPDVVVGTLAGDNERGTLTWGGDRSGGL